MGRVVRDICPTASGAKDWNPSAYSPRTGLALHPARQSVHGLRALDGELHRRHALRRRRGALQARARRPSRRVPGLGRAAGASGLVDQRELPGLERRARDRRRRRLLRHHGGLVQGASTPGPASCCGSSRPAPGSSASRRPIAGRTAGSTSPSCPASAAGRAPSSPATSTRATGPRRSASSTPCATCKDARRREARSMCSAFRSALLVARAACSSAALARARELRVCADPNNLPFSNEAREGFENRIVELIAAGSRRDRRLHLVGAAARLRPQHAEGRAVRPRRPARRATSRCCARRGPTTARPTSS